MLDTLDADAPRLDRWLGAEGASILDCYLCPMLRWLALYPVGGTGWFSLARWPNLLRVAQAMDGRPEAAVAIAAEGLWPSPFSAPGYPNPPEGSPL